MVATRFLPACTLLLVAVPSLARNLVEPPTTRHVLTANARHLTTDGDIFSQRVTLQAKSMKRLVQLSTPINANTALQYGDDWQAYWRASNARNQRVGKTLEAVFAWRANKQSIRLGLPRRTLVTAAEGFPTHSADLVDVGLDGRILGRYQVKLGPNAAIKALTISKYDGMAILTARESLRTIEDRLRAKERRALRRGLPLPPKWQTVRDAIDNGRLPHNWAGKALPSIRGVENYDAKHVQRYFTASATHPRNAPQILRGRPLLANSGKLIGKVLIVGDVVGTSYVQVMDVNRYRAGEIGGAYLTYKSVLRTSQLSLAAYAVFTPEPTSKTIAAVAAGVLIIADIVSDPVYRHVYENRRNTAAIVLSTIDREERFHAARTQLLAVPRGYLTPLQ